MLYKLTLTSRQWQALARETRWHFTGHHAPSCLECGGYRRIANIGRDAAAHPDDHPVTVEEPTDTIVTARVLATGLGFEPQIWGQFEPQLIEAGRIAKLTKIERDTRWAAIRELRDTHKQMIRDGATDDDVVQHMMATWSSTPCPCWECSQRAVTSGAPIPGHNVPPAEDEARATVRSYRRNLT